MQIIVTVLMLLSWGHVFRNPYITDSYEIGYSAFCIILGLLMILL